MKKALIIFSFVFLLFSTSTIAQKQIEPQVQRDPVMEKDATHNLTVARQYFKLKKAYVATLTRCEEIIAANPVFSRIDEVLYLAGMSSYYLAEGKGKQKPVMNNEEQKKKYERVKLREDAVAYLNQLIENFPQSEFVPEAEKTLKLLEPSK